MYTNAIEGWMREAELDLLYNMAKTMDSIIEVGSWMGRSTHALLSGCRGTVTAIDHFKGSPGEEPHQGVSPYANFIKNVGHMPNLKVLKMPAEQAVAIVEPADMVFIDGDHNYAAVKRDILNYLPKAKKLICGHDYPNWPGVAKAVNEVFGKVEVNETIWCVNTGGVK